VQVGGAPPEEPIQGVYLVEPEGIIRFGLYGSVPVEDLTIDEANRAIDKHLMSWLKYPKVSICPRIGLGELHKLPDSQIASTVYRCTTLVAKEIAPVVKGQMSGAAKVVVHKTDQLILQDTSATSNGS
jgi:hypothetical protein